MENKAPETINQYIDMDVVQLIKTVTVNKSFSETNGMIKLMDMEHSRLMQLRDLIAKEFSTVKTNSKEFNSLFLKYVGTFVLEQKIIDRKALLEHIAEIKGVSGLITPLAPKSSVSKAPSHPERTSTSMSPEVAERVSKSATDNVAQRMSESIKPKSPAPKMSTGI